MPFFLTPHSKVALLEQSMKVNMRPDPPYNSICFPRVLFVNRGFINLARRNSVYRFFMRQGSKSGVAEFRFDGNETGGTQSFELSFDQAYKWIKFLDPPFFKVSCGLFLQDSPFLHLLNCVKGKMGLHTFETNDFLTGMIKSFWFQINELSCTAEFLKSSVAAALPSKQFDWMCIEEVGSTDDLKWALKQKTTRMLIRIDPEDEFVNGSHASNKEAFVNNILEKCVVDSWIANGPMFGIVSMVIETCPKLKQLNISCVFSEEYPPTFESTVARLVRINLFIKRLTKKLKESSVECVVSVCLFIVGDVEDNEYPRDCVEMFRSCISHFESVQEETKYLADGTFHTKFTIEHKDQNVSIGYRIYIDYDLEEDVDEMYNDNLE